MQRERLRQKIQRKSMLFKTIAGICYITFAILIAGGVIELYHMQRESTREFRALLGATLSNTDVVFERYLEETEALINRWYGSSDGTKCRLSDEYSAVKNMAFVSRLQADMSGIPYLHSLYIYNFNRECNLMLGNGKEQTQPLENTHLGYLQDTKYLKNCFFELAENKYKSDKAVPLLCVYKQESSMEEERYLGAFVLNLDATLLSRTLFAEIEEDYVIRILDEEGTIVLSSCPEECGSRNPEEEEGWEYVDMESSRPGFKLVSGFKRGGFRNGAGRFFLPVFLVICVMAAAVVLVTIIWSFHLYRPFYNVMNDIEKNDLIKKNKGNDVQIFQSYYEQLSEHILDLNKKMEKEQFVRNLLTGGTHAEVQEILLQNGIVSEENGYYVVLVAMAEIGEGENAALQEYDALRAMIRSIFCTKLQEFGVCTAFDLGVRKILLVVSEESGKRIEEERLLCVLEKARKTSGEIRENKIYTLVSERSGSGKESCAIAYSILNDGLVMQQLLENDRVIKRENKEIMSYPKEAEKSVLESLKKKDYEAYMESVRKFLASGEQCLYHTFVFWLELLSVEIMKVNSPKLKKENVPEKSADHMVRQIEQFQSRGELEEWFSSLFYQISVRLNRISSHSNVKAVEQAVDYIRSNYDNPDINVSMLADMQHISAAYFGKLFREFVGTSAAEYLTGVRMEKAYGMFIENPAIEISEAAQKVGISNPSYFTAVFKKKYGVSPSKLRDYHGSIGKE